MLYAIHATLETEHAPDARGIVWSSMRQVPTFYLDADVQGITSPGHAEKIAREILTGSQALSVGSPD